MKEELKKAGIQRHAAGRELVYGDDQDDKKPPPRREALAKAHPNQKGVISPTTIGIRAGGG